MIYVGIDPGQTGAVSIIEHGRARVFDTPVQQVKSGRSVKNDYVPAAMADLLRFLPPIETHCFLELVHSMPKQGVSSTFQFGKGYGIWLGILGALGIPFTLVTPQAWKKELMQGQADKDAARGRAVQLFPYLSGELSRKKDIGRADALLICFYGSKQFS